MISYIHKCIFIHIPRTGGTSIENLIWPTGPAGKRTERDLWMGFVDKYHNKHQTGGLQHLFATHILSEVGDATFTRYFKFSIVRNPWDKAVSQFAYMVKRKDLRNFIGMKQDDCFKRYLELISRKRHVQWEQQVRFLRDAEGAWLVDYVGRYEVFSQSVDHILKSLGLETCTIPHEKRSERGSYQDYYNDESREIVAQLYKEDIEAFGYSYA
jgi:hypothetical protein